VVAAKIRGVHVERDQLVTNGEAVLKEIEAIDEAFLARFAEEIKQVERMKLLKRIQKLKKLKGRKNYVKRLRAKPELFDKEIAFKTSSNSQLAMLFVDVLKIAPKFFTAKGSPAFKSTMLGQWGTGGEMLGTRRKRLLVLKQICNLLKVTEYDGRYHIDLKLSSVATGRFAGGQVV
jgi:hypothetical protein